jgi:hypothetical protein
MCFAPTCHVANVRQHNSPHQAVILCHIPEYQCLWFQFYRASNFKCMAITTEPSSPSGPPSAADWAVISIAAALETSVTTTAVVAFATVAVTLTNDDDHPRNGHNIDNCLHDGYKDMIIDNSPPSLLFLSNNDEGNAFPTRHAPSNTDTIATTTNATAVAAAVAATTTDNEDNDNNDVRIHPLPSQQQLSVATRSRRQEPRQSKLPCHLSFLAP